MTTRSNRQKSLSSDPMVVAEACIEEAYQHQVTKLDLSGLDLVEVPDSLGQLRQLRSLNLAQNRLRRLPESLGQLSQLRSLNLSNNVLRSLPESLGQLSQLQILFLAGNRLAESPGQFREVQSLNLWGNYLTEISEVIGQLRHLQSLDFSQNGLHILPEILGELKYLRHLFLARNELRSLPESLEQLRELQALNLWGNYLTEIPEVVSRLRQLQRLDFSQNGLHRLPESLGQFRQLQALNLWGNYLTEIPEAIGQLRQLQSLNLSNNVLRSLPESLGQLNQLQSLNLRGNQLHILPVSLKQLTTLKELYLHDNEQLGLLPEVLGPDRDQVLMEHALPVKPIQLLDYYFRVRLSSRPLNEAKLIFIGRGGVGKTSLVNQLVHHQFKPNEKKTEGIKITQWPLRINNTEDVKLHIWDFGGQEIMHATHQFFLTQRSLYLLVLNGREGGEDADAEYWLKLIESFGGDSPVIVVFNKIREHPFDLNRRGLQQKYPCIRDFIATDCKDVTGIEELHKIIVHETDRLEHLRDPFPAMWFHIKEQLAAMKKNYIEFEQYRAFCQQYGEADHTAQNALAAYLHNLGIVLNFKDDVRLQDTHVLNPHWVTNGIYKILNSEILAQQKGEIWLSDASAILDRQNYPPQMCQFIFDLMKKFDLCFSFADDDFHYLVPELLNKQEPEATAEFKPESCLNFQYQYPILPEGLLPRFIVRTHHLSKQLPRWRTGVILEDDGNTALVKADVQDKKVFISVAGSLHGRRRLLAVIRSVFAQIHHSIRNLNPSELVPLPAYPNVVVPYDDLRVWEQARKVNFEMVADGNIITVNVAELLNGVDNGKQGDRHTRAIRVFYSYSHKDAPLRDELENHLKILWRNRLIESWHDRQIEAGDLWKDRIDEHLEQADIILLLISADFIASTYCYEKEMQRALERHKQGSACVIPIIIRETNWRIAPFRELQALPRNAVAVKSWTDRDAAWTHVSQGIQRVVEEMQRYR